MSTRDTQGMSEDEIALMEDMDEAGNPRDDDAPQASADADEDDADETQAPAATAAESDPEDAEDEPAPGPEAAPAEPAATAEAAPAAEPAQAPAAPQPYAVEVPADAGAQIAALKAETRAAHTKLLDGEMEPEAYYALEDKNTAAIETIRDAQRKAAIFAEMAAQQAQQQWQQAQDVAFMKFKAEGLDYRDTARPGLKAAYNVHLKALGADPKNEGRDAMWFLTEAHKATMRDLGIQPNAAAPAPAPAPRRGVDLAAVPPTLSRVPPAADASIQGNEFAHLESLKGEALEMAVAKLTPEQLDRYLP